MSNKYTNRGIRLLITRKMKIKTTMMLLYTYISLLWLLSQNMSRRLKTIFFFTVLEAGSQKSRC